MSHQLWGSFHWWIWAFCDGGNKGGFSLTENRGIWHLMLVKRGCALRAGGTVRLCRGGEGLLPCPAGVGVSFCSLNTAIISALPSPCLAHTGEGDSSATSHLPMCGQSTWNQEGRCLCSGACKVCEGKQLQAKSSFI